MKWVESKFEKQTFRNMVVSLLSAGVRKMEFDSIPNAYRPYKNI